MKWFLWWGPERCPGKKFVQQTRPNTPFCRGTHLLTCFQADSFLLRACIQFYYAFLTVQRERAAPNPITNQTTDNSLILATRNCNVREIKDLTCPIIMGKNIFRIHEWQKPKMVQHIIRFLFMVWNSSYLQAYTNRITCCLIRNVQMERHPFNLVCSFIALPVAHCLDLISYPSSFSPVNLPSYQMFSSRPENYTNPI